MKDEKVLKKSLINVILKIFLWSVFMPLIALLSFFAINYIDFKWLYQINPDMYYILRSFYNNLYYDNILIAIIAIIWLIGILIIIYKVITKYNSFIISISHATKNLFNKDVDYIELPSELEEFQRMLNHLKKENENNEKKALEEEQRKNDLIVYLAHDLKTPLTSIIGYLSLINEINDMPKKKREKYIKVALDKAYKLEDLINELFDIARFNSETIIINKERLNIKLLLEQVIEEFYPVLMEEEKEVKITGNDFVINGDPLKLARVFANLIKNAINYSTDKTIDISLLKKDTTAEIIISNKGVLIPEEKLKRIFEKFYRVDIARNTKTGGSGVGLAIAKEIIELHKGEIHATSDTEYTKFYITLPLA